MFERKTTRFIDFLNPEIHMNIYNQYCIIYDMFSSFSLIKHDLNDFSFPQEELDQLGLREAMLFAKPIRDMGERQRGESWEELTESVFLLQPVVNVCIDVDNPP